MDKQDAIDFIVDAFEAGRSPQEIAASLSAQMGAPLEVVARFVNRTLEQRQALHDEALSRLDGAAAAYEPPQAPPATPKWTDTVAKAPTGSPFAGQTPETPQPTEQPYLPDEISGLREQAPALEADVEALAPEAPAASAAVDPRLEKFILDLLYKNGKRSDLVMAVAERAAVDWREAEQLVASVEATHHKKIKTRHNVILVPMSLTFIAIGLGLTYAGVSELGVLGPFFSALLNGGGQAAFQTPLPLDLNMRAFWALGIGAALIIGGIIGVIQAVRSGAANQAEKSTFR